MLTYAVSIKGTFDIEMTAISITYVNPVLHFYRILSSKSTF